MAQPLQTFSITAPGFYGLNTQDSSLDLASGFALVANNCVIDQYGRIGARKGWVPQNSYNAALGTSPVRSLEEHVGDDGSTYVMCAGNNKVFRLVSGALTEITYDTTLGTQPVITGDNWSICHLGGAAFAFQIGHDPLVFDSALSTTKYRRVSELPNSVGTVQKANFAMAAFGRIWNVDTTTDKSLIQWSDLNAPQKWNAGSAGTLDTTNVWPNGNDTVVGMAAHNNYLFIFGRNNILIYNNANIVITGSSSLTAMTLEDTITGIGCIARDSIQYTGSDVIFLSNTGVRSVMRTIQEKSAPFRDLSKNVRTDLMNAVAGEDLTTIKSVYNPFDSFYLLTLPILKTVYCFDMRSPLQDGAAKVTTWDGMEPSSLCMLRNNTMLIGKAGYVGKYTGYLDNGSSYRMQYFTNHTDLGAPSVSSILKKLSVVVIGGSDQYVTIKWGYDFTGNYSAQNVQIPSQGVAYFGVSEYNIASYSPGTSLQTLVAYPTGSGKVIQTGYESDITGGALSIQKLEILAKNGKII